MKPLHRNWGLYPELWRVRCYGIRNGNEGWFSVLVMAPKLEDVFEVVRGEVDEDATFEAVTHGLVYFSEKCFALPKEATA